MIGRSHRSKLGKARLQEVIERSRRVLGVPADYRIGIVPASDTGAVEMALWSLLGPRPVDLLAWESFGEGWVGDVLKQLKLPHARRLAARYGQLPDLGAVDFDHDVVFTWNGTTSGVRVPDGDWVPDGRAGLAICDATSAAFAMDLPWAKLDVVTWSWQKVLGGEAAHGMIVLSARAVERLESYVPPWPLPKIFRMTAGDKLIEGLFEGETINTPSMLAVEDAVDGLKWAESIGGMDGLLARTRANFAAIDRWVAATPWIRFLAERPETRSTTSVCLVFADDWFRGLAPDAQAKAAKDVAAKLEAEGVAFDIGSYRDAPPGLRIWAGATVETADIEALLPWIDWAYAEVRGA
ncbi:phosphoserine aminotransferase [Aliidongia dinghuensis]|uniref:phosphoserine transaminase n=1 Tax=Aliidongia dinghuensis TaxID=1867774 RepID=A0A8J2YT06_9PROT|nr:phosphoserine aminotransferase [Aliidongia dinghuensis]